MAIVSANYGIETNRGDVLGLVVKTNNSDGSPYEFQVGDVIRFKLMEKSNVENIILQKDVQVEEVCESVLLQIPSQEMKIGELINKPVEYWYEIELNPDTEMTMTILGYTKKSGPRILTLTPEGGDKE